MRSFKLQVICCLFVLTSLTHVATPTLGKAVGPERKFFWNELKTSNRLLAGEVVPPDKPATASLLKLEGQAGAPSRIEFLVIENPAIATSSYAISGEVRYENIKGQGYLEMVSYFASSTAFSRTLGEGLLAPLSGSSSWTPFMLPFSMGQSKERPHKLTLSVYLPAGGTVYLSPLRLIDGITMQQLTPNSNGMKEMKPAAQWLSSRQAEFAGALGGALLGLVGAVIGALAGLGKGRRITLALVKLVIALSVASLMLGFIALFSGQPYIVYYPLFLLGVIGSAVFGGCYPQIKKRYAQIELRKIEAKDRGSR